MDNKLSYYSDFTSLVIEGAAKDLQADYTHTAPLDLGETGMYNNPEMSGLETDRLQFREDGVFCEYYMARVSESQDESLRYIPKPKQDFYADKYNVLVYSMELPFAVPSIYIESRISSWRSYGIKKRVPQKLQSVELEGDFNTFFNVYMDDRQRATTAFEVLAPDVMYALLALNDDIDVEFAGRRLYFYKLLRKKKQLGWSGPGQFSWDEHLVLKKQDYVKYLEFYRTASRKFSKAARLVKTDEFSEKAKPLYLTAGWPRRSRMSYEAKQAWVAYLVPLVVIAILLPLIMSPNGVVKNDFLIAAAIYSLLFLLAVSAFVMVLPYSAGMIVRMWWQNATVGRLRRKLARRYEQGVASEVSLRK